jgi:hypothetical protein
MESARRQRQRIPEELIHARYRLKMLDAIGDTAFWSTSAEVIAGLVVAVVFTDVATTETPRHQVRWYGTLRVAAFVAIAGGLGGCLVALAHEGLRRVALAVLVLVSVATLGGLVGIRIVRLEEQARRKMKARGADDEPSGTRPPAA